MKVLHSGFIVFAFISHFGISNSSAQVDQSIAPPTQDLAAVQVNVKSPPIWLFSKGDKKIIILGTQLPLPVSGVVITDSIHNYIENSDAVLTGPGLRPGDDVGLFRGLTLVSSMRKAQRNKDNKTLAQVVPADAYRRWEILKAKYIGRDSGVERFRPMYAAYELYAASLKRNGLTDTPMLGPVIAKATNAAGMQRVDARYSLPSDNLRRKIKEFDVAEADDVGCFVHTLNVLEAYLEYSPAAAEAWAVGDMARYRSAEKQYVPIDGCWERLTNEAIGRSSGIADPYAKVDSTWHAAVMAALAAHNVVFTTLPARDLVKGTGLAAKLRQDGFAVSALFSE